MATINTINTATDTPASAATTTNNNFTSLETDVDLNTAKTSYTDSAAVALNTAKVSADGSIDTHSDVDVTTTAPVDGEALKYNSSTEKWESGVLSELVFATLSDTKATNTTGGTSVAATWTTRDLNTEDYDNIGVTISSDEFTLPAGKYLIESTSPFHDCGYFQTRLYNVTDTATEQAGTTGYASTSNGFGQSNISTVVDISVSTTYRIEYFVNTAVTHGLGYPVSSGESNIFTTVKITQTP